jgi:hypothetical protein
MPLDERSRQTLALKPAFGAIEIVFARDLPGESLARGFAKSLQYQGVMRPALQIAQVESVRRPFGYDISELLSIKSLGCSEVRRTKNGMTAPDDIKGRLSRCRSYHCETCPVRERFGRSGRRHPNGRKSVR